MYSFVFFSISAICFFGGLISVIMAVTGNATEASEHWKNAAIYGSIAPFSMFASIYLFWTSGRAAKGDVETPLEKRQRLKQLKREAWGLGMHSILQGIFIGIGSAVVLLFRGLNPMFAMAIGGGCVALGIVILLISLSKTATNISAIIGRAAFVLIIGVQVALALVTLMMVVVIQFGFLEIALGRG